MSADVVQILDVVANKGLGYFALYIVYHYTGHVIGAFLMLRVGVFFVKTLDGWVQRYLDIKEEMHKISKEIQK